MSSNRYYVDSLAYDFDMFLPKEKREDNIVEFDKSKKQNPQQKKQPQSLSASADANQKAQARSVKTAVSRKLSVVAIVLFFMAIFCGQIFLRVQITETSTQIAKTQTLLNNAKSENVSLEMEMENCISYKNLEQSAEELGMQKIEKYQVNYIVVNEEDKGEVLGDQKALTAQNNE